MQVDTGSFRALAARVDRLAADLERYRDEACTIRSFDQLCINHMGQPARPVTARRSRPRHLRAVRGEQ